MYLDALFSKDPHLASEYSDSQVILLPAGPSCLARQANETYQVELYAEYGHSRLMDFLRASNYYSLERAYRICHERDYVPEMVFLLGRMGNNKKALMLIIERLGDVERVGEWSSDACFSSLKSFRRTH
jgi:vacuolar protein sorting-associated protein 41